MLYTVRLTVHGVQVGCTKQTANGRRLVGRRRGVCYEKASTKVAYRICGGCKYEHRQMYACVASVSGCSNAVWQYAQWSHEHVCSDASRHALSMFTRLEQRPKRQPGRWMLACSNSCFLMIQSYTAARNSSFEVWGLAKEFMISWLRKSANIDESIPSKHCSLKQLPSCKMRDCVAKYELDCWLLEITENKCEFVEAACAHAELSARGGCTGRGLKASASLSKATGAAAPEERTLSLTLPPRTCVYRLVICILEVRLVLEVDLDSILSGLHCISMIKVQEVHGSTNGTKL